MSERIISIKDFCDKFEACPDGRAWALENCLDMDEVWKKAKADWLIWIATRPGLLDDKTLRKFACFCARQVRDLMTDERSLNAVVVAEKHTEGNANYEEISSAWDAWDTWDVSWAAVRSAASESARDATMAKQADWLRKNATPNFEVKK